MSFLPYGGGGTGGWIGAFGVSGFAHAGIVTGMVLLYNQAINLPPPGLQTSFEITTAIEEIAPEPTVTEVPDMGEVRATDAGEEVGAADPASEIVEQVIAEAEGTEFETVEDETIAAAAEDEEVAAVAADTIAEEVPDEPFQPLGTETPPVEDTATAFLPEDPVGQDQTSVLDVDDSDGSGLLIDEGGSGTGSFIDPVGDGGLTAIDDGGTIGTDAPPPAEPITQTPVDPLPEVGDGGVAVIASSDVIGAIDDDGPLISLPDDDVIDTTAPPPIPPVGTGDGPAGGFTQAPPSAQDLALTDLIRRIRLTEADPCLAALPRRDGETGVGLALMADDERAMEAFSTALVTEADAGTTQTRALLDPRQCAAVSYIRNNVDYPAARLGMRLNADQVASGGSLTGVIRGTAGSRLMLLLIDDNGVVQDLGRFVVSAGDTYRFEVPVTRAGPPRDTRNILLALAFRDDAGPLEDRLGLLAQDVFSGLPGVLAEGAEMAVATFDVR